MSSEREGTVKLARRQFLHLTAGAAVIPAISRGAMAQAYPSRPITMIVPFAAGGPVDTLGRIVVERMRVSLRQPVIIENVTGAAGTIATGRAARASPDGYTILFGNWSSHVVVGAIYRLPYDLLKDFEPVALLASTPLLVLSKNTVPASNLKQLIAWLKANQDKVSVGTSGTGGGSHVAGVFFQNLIGAHFQFVPYRGAGSAINDMIAGQIDLILTGVNTALPQVRAGGIKAYAVTVKARIRAAPDIPTVDEAGLPEFYVSD
jgi:tripartite-type tricarboxylate transporter receptor subunit TctC